MGIDGSKIARDLYPNKTHVEFLAFKQILNAACCSSEICSNESPAGTKMLIGCKLFEEEY